MEKGNRMDYTQDHKNFNDNSNFHDIIKSILPKADWTIKVIIYNWFFMRFYWIIEKYQMLNN